MRHHQYYVFVPLADPDSGPVLAEAILAALREDNTAVMEFQGERLQLEPLLRDRDHWALVLAELSDKELEIFGYDDVPTREAKISELLDSFGDSPAQ